MIIPLDPYGHVPGLDRLQQSRYSLGYLCNKQALMGRQPSQAFAPDDEVYVLAWDEFESPSRRRRFYICYCKGTMKKADGTEVNVYKLNDRRRKDPNRRRISKTDGTDVFEEGELSY